MADLNFHFAAVTDEKILRILTFLESFVLTGSLYMLICNHHFYRMPLHDQYGIHLCCKR